MTIRGIPISDPVTAFIEAATLLDLDQLVAAGDYLVLDPRLLDPLVLRPLASVEALRVAAFASRARGVIRARAASDLVRAGVESPMETSLRLLLGRAGLPEPVCGFELTKGSRRVGWFDLAWPDYKVIAEYDGDAHRVSTTQYERDIRRFDDAHELDWHVVRVRKYGILKAPADTVARVSRALTRRGWSSGRNRR